MERYTLAELAALPTLCVGQTDDLKVDTGTVRVWLSRCDVEDGELYAYRVTVEKRQNGRWEEVGHYQVRPVA